MVWRIRTTLADRPGNLADVARACGRAEVNIRGMQVFAAGPAVTDEFIVDAPGWTDVRLAGLFESAGGTHVAVTRVSDDAVSDATTRYLLGAHQVLDDGRSAANVLHELLETAPPDVADYAGHDVLDLTRQDGTVLRVSRAVAFTPVERARAQALLDLVAGAGADVPLLTPSPRQREPLVREAALQDMDAVSALHHRCSVETLYQRYQVPLRMPMATRMARRLVSPLSGTALVVQVGSEVVGHGTLECIDSVWTCRLLIEDAWQGQGLDMALVKHAAGRAKGCGADRLTFVTAGSHDWLLRAIGDVGFMARIERHAGEIRISVPLAAARAIPA